MDTERLILDRYRLTERIAAGGSAEVWRAVDEQLDRPVAVKLLHPHLLPDATSRQRLVAEARAAAGLSHPGIVGIYDIDADGEAPALVMELVDGESVATRLARDGGLSPHEASRIGAEVAEALYHAHQRGIVHRDVKPGNILLGTDGRARLVDFGIAHSLAVSAERLTQAGSVIGTMRHMAPEQLRDGQIGPRTDLYGLGTVLFEMLTNRPPYAAATPLGLAEEQAAGLPALDGIDPALGAVIAACLAFDAGDRPLHAGALAAALRAWRGAPSDAARIAAAGRAVDTAAITRPTPAIPVGAPHPESPPPRASRRRARAGAPLLALAGLAVLAIIVSALIGLGDVPAIASEPTATPSATPAATPTPLPATPSPTPMPEWLARLMSDYVEDCGPDGAEQAAAEASAMREREARDHLKDLRDECRERDDDDDDDDD